MLFVTEHSQRERERERERERTNLHRHERNAHTPTPNTHTFDHIFDHVQKITAWQFYKSLPPADLLVVNYEELVKSPAVELRRVLSFLGQPVSDALLHCAVNASGDFKRPRSPLLRVSGFRSRV